MDGEFRRQQILKEIQQSGTPVSGKKLAGKYSVSRQVIVQDIAILRAAGNDIVSTCRGYVCQKSSYARRTIQVRHTDDEIMEELNVIVDFGERRRTYIFTIRFTERSGRHWGSARESRCRILWKRSEADSPVR